jgi:hypothetical protein
VEQAREVLARLERIDALEQRLLAELRALAPYAERWADEECDTRAAAAAVALLARTARAGVRDA